MKKLSLDAEAEFDWHRSLRKVLAGQAGARERKARMQQANRLDFILYKTSTEGFQEEND